MSGDSTEQLSQRLREQVASLHGPAQSPLGQAAQQRVLERLVAESASLQRKRAWRSQAIAGTGVVLLSAAAVLLYLRAPLQRAAPEPQAGPVDQQTRAQAPAPTCGLPVLSSGELAMGTSHALALGALGELVAQPDSQLRVEHSDACELVLRLSDGTLAGDLHSLRPARLVIRTSHGEVIVTGTRFSVHSDAELEVLLQSGVVDVKLKDGAALRLQPGTRLYKSPRAERSEQQALTHTDEQRLSRWLEPSSQPVAQEPKDAGVAAPDVAHRLAPQPAFESTAAAFTAAESARRAQRWAAAREAYQAASQGRDGGAEVALLRWARFELDEQAAPKRALHLVAQHKRRFAKGSLGAEAGWIEVQARKSLGQNERALHTARRLIARHPNTPQAAAAEKLLQSSP